MSVVTIASRYAKSLLELAVEKGIVEEVLEDIKTFQSATQSKDFYLMLKSPLIQADKKKAVIETLFADKINEVTLSFINILIKKGREELLPEIDDEFIAQYKKMKHITTVKLTTAAPISDAQMKTIKEKLNKSEATFENLDLHTEVNEDLIGGFVIEIGDKLYDASVAHKLDTLKKEMIVKH